jgi:glycosyltransferase involved in cell wall biosynthesis
MNVLIVHNDYGGYSGEEAVVDRQERLLQEHGHRVTFYRRRSEEIGKMVLGRSRAFCSGIYNNQSIKSIRSCLAQCNPDVIHIHNLFPLISPAILPECSAAGVPLVMSVHNYRLVCPNGLHVPKGRYEICEKCCGGREYWCLLKNCEGNFLKSLGYAMRNVVARKARFYHDHISIYACLTDFQRRRLIREGYSEDRIAVVPNMVGIDELEGPADLGEYVGFVGRISPEKGIGCLLEASRRLTRIPFKLAGDLSAMPEIEGRAATNVEFCGRLAYDQMYEFYKRSRFVVLPSIWFEGFPMVLVEAMSRGKAIVASRIGGVPEIVDEGLNGLLFQPGNAGDLAEKIQHLWSQPELCRQMGLAGREKAIREYSPERHYERLMVVYQSAIQMKSKAPVLC